MSPPANDKLQDPKTPMEAFEHLRPWMDDLTKLIDGAPLDAKGRAGLAVIVAGAAVGMAIGCYQRNLNVTEAVARRTLVEVLQDLAAPQLKIVPKESP